MNERTVRKLFIFILIFLPIQYVVVGIVGYYKAEPWPAFVFPGFKSVHQEEGMYLISQTRFEFYNDENEKINSVQPHLLFTELPRSQIAGLTRTLFHNKAKVLTLSSEAKELLYKEGSEVTGREFHRMEIVQVIEYLKHDKKNLTPDSTVQNRIARIEFTH